MIADGPEVFSFIYSVLWKTPKIINFSYKLQPEKQTLKTFEYCLCFRIHLAKRFINSQVAQIQRFHVLNIFHHHKAANGSCLNHAAVNCYNHESTSGSII